MDITYEILSQLGWDSEIKEHTLLTYAIKDINVEVGQLLILNNTNEIKIKFIPKLSSVFGYTIVFDKNTSSFDQENSSVNFEEPEEYLHFFSLLKTQIIHQEKKYS